MAETTRDAQGRFTSAGASAYGRRGAEARERRIQEHGDSPEARRRVQQQALSSAIALVHLVYGPPWRPRRVPHREEEMAPRLSEAIDVLQRALDAEQNAHTWRAARTLLHLWSCLEAASSAPRRRNTRPRR